MPETRLASKLGPDSAMNPKRLASATRFAGPTLSGLERLNRLARLTGPGRFGVWLLAACIACLVPGLGASAVLAAGAGVGAAGAERAAQPTAEADGCDVAPTDFTCGLEVACGGCTPQSDSDAESTTDDEDRSPEISDDHLVAHHDGTVWFSSGSRIPLITHGELRAAFTTPPPRPSGRS